MMTCPRSATTRPLRALVYEDQSRRGPDHSGNWLRLTCRALADVGCRVTALLDVPGARWSDLDIGDPAGVRVVRPHDVNGLAAVPIEDPGPVPVPATQLLLRLDQQDPFDLVLVSGLDVARQVVREGDLGERLWLYLSAEWAPAGSLSSKVKEDVSALAQQLGSIICESEDLRSLLDGLVPGCAGKTFVAPDATRVDHSAEVSARPALGSWHDRLTGAFPREPALERRTRPLRVAVAGHDFKFATGLLRYFRSLPGVDLRVDHWATRIKHDSSVSEQIAAWADVVVCEWCGPNAVWYSQHKRSDQRLLVRFHRAEIEGQWLEDIRIDAIDRIACVSAHFAREVAERTGWPGESLSVIPNALDVQQFDRPKLSGAAFHLGMIGMAPSLKRFDLALDVLEALRQTDDRFMLHVKGQMPWDYGWVWRRDHERRYFSQVFKRLQSSPWLSDAVVFDGFGPDVGAYLRRIGFVLSTSDLESFHLGVAEGMASRAVPVFLPRAGVTDIYSQRWTYPDPAAAAHAILQTVTSGSWANEGDQAHHYVGQRFDIPQVAAAWLRLLLGENGIERENGRSEQSEQTVQAIDLRCMDRTR